VVAACEVGGIVLLTYGLQQWRREQSRKRARQALTPPPILPAWIFDNSEQPDGGRNWYCPDCWLEWMRDHPRQSYFEPDGVRQFCAAHVTSTLAHALNAQSMEKHA
jgi:hypothetical protein